MYDSNTTVGFLEISSSATSGPSSLKFKPAMKTAFVIVTEVVEVSSPATSGPSTLEFKPSTKTALVIVTETVIPSPTTPMIISTTFPSSTATSKFHSSGSSPSKVGATGPLPVLVSSSGSIPVLVSSSSSIPNTGVIIMSAATESHGVHTSSFQTDQPPSATAETVMGSSDGGSSPNAAMIILIVIGVIAACALALLFIWWCRGRRYGTRRNVIYPFLGNPGGLAYEQKFRQAFGQRPYFELESNSQGAINPFTASRSSFGDIRRANTPTSLGEQTNADIIVIGRSGLSSPHVRFEEKPLRDSENLNSDRGTGPGHPAGIRKGATQGDRPPTYCTNSTGLATITTLLPQYSAVDPSPSPISERSESSPTPNSFTTPSPQAFSQRRGFGRHPHHLSPLTPIGEKF